MLWELPIGVVFGSCWERGHEKVCGRFPHAAALNIRYLYTVSRRAPYKKHSFKECEFLDPKARHFRGFRL